MIINYEISTILVGTDSDISTSFLPEQIIITPLQR